MANDSVAEAVVTFRFMAWEGQYIRGSTRSEQPFARDPSRDGCQLLVGSSNEVDTEYMVERINDIQAEV